MSDTPEAAEVWKVPCDHCQRMTRVPSAPSDVAEEYDTARRNFNRMRDDGTLPPSPIPAAPSDVAGPIRRLSEYRQKPITLADGKQFITVLPEDADDILALIESLSHDREVMREALEDVVSAVAYTEVDCGRRSYGLKTSFGAAFQKARAALASVKGEA